MTVKWLVGLGTRADNQRLAVVILLYSVKTLAELYRGV